jgi:hypothetical protein
MIKLNQLGLTNGIVMDSHNDWVVYDVIFLILQEKPWDLYRSKESLGTL